MPAVLEYAVIAVDGGGTRCRLALESAGARHMVEAGAANVTTDFDAAIRTIISGLEQLATNAGCTVTELGQAPAFVGLAGVTGPAISARVAEALPFARVRVEDDRLPALRGALGAQGGAIAHCGTGSFLALQTDTRTRLAGGWGSILGDEASAMWVGRLALSETLRAADGLIDATPLTQGIHEALGSTADIVAYAKSATPAQFGTFARRVTASAAKDDPLARSILQAGADQIALALPRLGWEPGMALCLTGGFGRAYAEYLPWTLRDALQTPQGDPIDGAIALAQHIAQEVRHERC